MTTLKRLKFHFFQICVLNMLACTANSGIIFKNTLCSAVFSQNETNNTSLNNFGSERDNLFVKIKKLFSPRIGQSRTIEINEKIYSELAALQTLLYIGKQRDSVYYDQKGPHPVPEFLTCNFFTYKPIAVLGGGNEGTAFLVVDSAGKYFVLKKFLNYTKMLENTLIAEKLYDKKIEITLPISVDRTLNTAIYRFIDGVEVADILRKSNYWELNNLDYPISEETQKFFEIKYVEFVQNHRFYPKLVPGGINDSNVIFDLITSQFVIVDPR